MRRSLSSLMHPGPAADPGPPGPEPLFIARWKAIKDDVDRIKWLESEKAGHDIGWDRAWTLWMTARGKRAVCGDHATATTRKNP